MLDPKLPPLSILGYWGVILLGIKAIYFGYTGHYFGYFGGPGETKHRSHPEPLARQPLARLGEGPAVVGLSEQGNCTYQPVVVRITLLEEPTSCW